MRDRPHKVHTSPRSGSSLGWIPLPCPLLLLITLILILAACSATTLLHPNLADANDDATSYDEVVRVGVVEQVNHMWPDEDGYEHGLDAEYTYKIAQYAGFSVEFVVYGNYDEVLVALEADEVQMSVGVSKTGDREDRFLFADTPFAQSSVSLYAHMEDDRFSYGDTEAIASARIGGVVGSSMLAQTEAWAEQEGISPEFVVYQSEEEFQGAIDEGQIDLFALPTSSAAAYRRVQQLSTTAYYPVFNKGEERLCARVNDAMSRILYEDSQYATKLINKYESNLMVSEVALAPSESTWIEEHPTTTVAVVTGDAPFYHVNSEGKETGIVVDLYDTLATTCGTTFEYVAFDSKDDAIAAVTSGETDILGIVGEDMVLAEKEGLVLTKTFTDATLSLVVASNADDEVASVAVPEDDLPVLESPLKALDYEYDYKTCKGLESCLAALDAGEVDAVLCDTSQATWLINQHRSGAYEVRAIGGASMGYAGAVAPANATLGSIVSKASQSSDSYMGSVIARNTTREKGLTTFLQTLPIEAYVAIFSVTLVLVAIAAVLLIRLMYQRNQIRLAEANTEAEAARKAHRAESEFLSSMSHDMRTPLNGILGFTELALKSPDYNQRQEYLEKIDTSGHLMLDIVNDVLDLSKIESGKMELRATATNPRVVFQKVTTSVQQLAESRHQDFQTRYENDDMLWVSVDQVRLQQIVLNLLSNAVKYTPEGGTVFWEMSLVRRGPWCTMSNVISDTGIGMSEEFQAKMFEAFTQESQKSAQGTQGTGLGLSIVKRIVDAMGGSITTKSMLGRGTTFSVLLSLPVVKAVEEAEQATDEDASATAEIAGMRVLLCEDNAINAELTQAMLAEHGVTDVTWATDGAAGVKEFSESPSHGFGAVLMDLRMPTMDGIEATKRIRALKREDAKTVPIVAMTADAYAEDERRCRDAGMDDHITKPVDVTELVSCLARLKR